MTEDHPAARAAAVGEDQRLAARALGLRHWQSLALVELPQMFCVSLSRARQPGDLDRAGHRARQRHRRARADLPAAWVASSDLDLPVF